MHNILSMDLYRMKKTKGTYILYAIFLGFLALIVYTSKLSMTMNLAGPGSGVGTVTEFVDQMTQGNTCIFIVVIFIAMFINAEFNSGYIKNIMGDISKKEKYVFSKVVVTTLYITLFEITDVIVSIISAKAVLNIGKFGDVGHFLGYIIVNYILNLALGYLMVFVTVALRNSTASMSIGTLYTLIIGNLTYRLVNLAVAQVFHLEDFDISKYFVLGNLNLLNSASSSGELIRGLIVAIIFGTAAIAGSIVVVKRSDT